MSAGKTYTISSFRSGFFHQIVEIEKSSFRNPYSPESLRLLTMWCPRLFLTAISSEIVLGYVVASAQDVHAHIISLAVRPKYRRQGIGSDLLRSLLECLQSIGVEKVMLEVREGNLAAAALYEKLGFEQSGTIDRYYEDGCPATVLEKRLVKRSR